MTALFPPSPGGGELVDHGYKGKGVLIHLLADKNGHPLFIENTGARGNEKACALTLLKRMMIFHPLVGVAVEADRGYDAYWLRTEILQMKALPLIPYRRNVTRAPSIGDMCSRFGFESVRWKVERTFSWLKRKYRRLMVRWERTSGTWKAFTSLALIHYWMKILVE